MNSFWINIYESEGIFSKMKKRWTTETLFNSKEHAQSVARMDSSEIIYIGAYKITLKQK